MKKRLIIIFIALAVIVLIIVLNSTVFTVQNAEISFYTQEGSLTVSPAGVNANELITDFVGKNIFFLSEDELIDALHASDAMEDYFCIAVTREFPNTVILHLAERQPIFYLSYGGTGYLIDNYGYCIGTNDTPSGYVNISNLSTWVGTIAQGKNVSWNSERQEDFNSICTVVNTVWRFNYDFEDIHELVKSFAFDSDVMTIETVSGAKIVIYGFGTDTENKMIQAISVYYSDDSDNTTSATTIEVDERGRVTTKR